MSSEDHDHPPHRSTGLSRSQSQKGQGAPKSAGLARSPSQRSHQGEDIPAILPRLAKLQQMGNSAAQGPTTPGSTQTRDVTPLHAPTPVSAHSNAFPLGHFTPMEHGSPESSPYASQTSSRRESFAHPHPMHSGPPSYGGSASASRRGSFAHPNASGPRPPMRRRDSMASGEEPPAFTPSLLSRAGSPTLPLMNDKTTSRSSSRRGSFVGGGGLGGGFGGGFGGGLEMSGMFSRKPTKEGEFVGAVDCGTT